MSKSKKPKLSKNQMSLWIYVVEQMLSEGEVTKERFYDIIKTFFDYGCYIPSHHPLHYKKMKYIGEEVN